MKSTIVVAIRHADFLLGKKKNFFAENLSYPILYTTFLFGLLLKFTNLFKSDILNFITILLPTILAYKNYTRFFKMLHALLISSSSVLQISYSLKLGIPILTFGFLNSISLSKIFFADI